MEYVIKGYSGRVEGERTIVHSPDGHLILCRKTNIKTREDLKIFMTNLYKIVS